MHDPFDPLDINYDDDNSDEPQPSNYDIDPPHFDDEDPLLFGERGEGDEDED